MLSAFITGFLFSGCLGACITRLQAVKYVAVGQGFDSIIESFRLKNQDRGKEIPMTGTHVTIAATDRATFDSYVASPVSENGAGVIIVSTISGVDSVMTYYADTLAAKRFIATAPDMIRRAASTRT